MEGETDAALEQPQIGLMNTGVVDECPPPPAYAKQFSTLGLQPPLLDEEKDTPSWSLVNQYNGAVGALALSHQHIAATVTEDIDFRTEMKRC
jgi:hypothetical protein